MSDELDAISPQPAIRTCPGCGKEVSDPVTPGDNLVVCPSCGMQFFVGSSEDEEEEPGQEINTNNDEIDANKIRQIATLRRGLYRTQSYYIVGMIACVVGSIQLLINTVLEVRQFGWKIMPVVYLCAIGILSVLFTLLSNRRVRLAEELRQSVLPQPSETPDFSTLRDGSQRVEALHDMISPEAIAPPDQSDHPETR